MWWLTGGLPVSGRTLSFFTPLTGRMPAARSGLKKTGIGGLAGFRLLKVRQFPKQFSECALICSLPCPQSAGRMAAAPGTLLASMLARFSFLIGVLPHCAQYRTPNHKESRSCRSGASLGG
jgi:hypothetical protein